MDDSDKGQVSGSAAEIYEEFFIPALFQAWPAQVAVAAHIQPGQRVLDVACGTGILARTIVDQVGPEGAVIGLDVNDGMLAVAQRKAPHIEWRQGVAEDLPFPDDYFDAVVSQFALMFFEDQQKALREMMRVVRPQGRLAVAVWASLDITPGYEAMVELLDRLFGTEAGDGIRAPYNLGDVDKLARLFVDAGIANAEITTHPGTANFPSLESWMYTDIKGWVLADMIDDDQFALLLEEAQASLASFVRSDGTVQFSSPAHIITVAKA